MQQARFRDVLLFTHEVPRGLPTTIRVVEIPQLKSSRDYSRFLLTELGDHIRTSHCLVVQWDGFVIDSRQWQPEFLECDYIGAPWPQFADGHDVGNGGFSLRSQRLLKACQSPDFHVSHPEDVAIGRVNREMLESDCGIVFAPREVAERFSFERAEPPGPTFGFHGVFNMIPVLGEDRFWQIYETLDERQSASADFRLLMRQIARGPDRLRRQVRLTKDRVRGLGRKRVRRRP